MTSVNAELFHREQRDTCDHCDGHGLVSGDDEDGVYFDTCSRCNGSGFRTSPSHSSDSREAR